MMKNIMAILIAMTTLSNSITTINSTEHVQTTSERFVDVTNELNTRLDIERDKLEEEIAIKQIEIDNIIADNNRKDNVTFNQYNVLEPTGLTAIELYNTLIGINNGVLAEFAWTLQECEEIYGINAFFLAGIIAHESGWVTSDRALYQNNLTGHAVYDSGATGTYFNSQDESIYNTAKLLYNNYLLPSGNNYHGESVRAVNKDYCLTEDRTATDYIWSDSIISIANNFNSYYHNNVKKLKDVPVIDIDIDKLLDDKRQEIVAELFNY